MRLAFNVISRENSRIAQYVNENGKVVTEKKISNAFSNQLVQIASSVISENSAIEKERTLYMAAVFFQRVVNRTPVDEDYFFYDKKSNDMKVHKADNDSVRDSWKISGSGFSFFANDFKELGVSFDEFNNKSEIDKIYEIIRVGARDSKSFFVTISNKHKRFSQLEFGEYLHDGDLKKGKKYYHGVADGYSVQAPYGMLRITQAEFGKIKLSSSTEKLIKSYVNRSKRTTKIPSESKLKRLRSLIENKTHLTGSDIGLFGDIL